MKYKFTCPKCGENAQLWESVTCDQVDSPIDEILINCHESIGAYEAMYGPAMGSGGDHCDVSYSCATCGSVLKDVDSIDTLVEDGYVELIPD